MLYASFGLLSIVIHFIINFEVIIKHQNPDNDVKKRYRSFLFSVMVYYITDVLWGFLYDSKIVPLVYADTVVYFLSMGLTVFLWMRFIVSFINRKSLGARMLIYSGWGIFLFQFGTLIVNLFRPLMFYFDRTGEYFPGTARYIALGLQVLLFVVLSVYTMLLSFRVEGREKLRYRAIGISGIVMFVFIILQTKYPLLPFYAIGCLIATCIIHTFVNLDDKVSMDQMLGSVKQSAYRDPLTNVKNVNSYTETKKKYEEKIQNKSIREFGIAVFDVNDLKKVNDTKGHDAGDKYLKDASNIICGVFKRSPVFRIGGDEFVAILEGEDYNSRVELFAQFNETVEQNLNSEAPVVSGGMDIYNPESDNSFDAVFERADSKMYERKKELKSRSL